MLNGAVHVERTGTGENVASFVSCILTGGLF